MSAAQLDASLCGNQDANVSHWLSEDQSRCTRGREGRKELEREREREGEKSDQQNLISVRSCLSLAQLMHSLSAFEQGARCADEHVGHAKSTHADTSSVRWTGQVCKSGGSVTQAVLVLGGGGGRRLSLFFFPLRSCGSVLIFPVCLFLVFFIIHREHLCFFRLSLDLESWDSAVNQLITF